MEFAALVQSVCLYVNPLGGVMVADMLGSLSFEFSEDRSIANQHDFQPQGGSSYADAEGFDAESGEPVLTFVRGSVLDACAARDRVERAAISTHIAAIDSDDNGLYRLFRNR